MTDNVVIHGVRGQDGVLYSNAQAAAEAARVVEVGILAKYQASPEWALARAQERRNASHNADTAGLARQDAEIARLQRQINQAAAAEPVIDTPLAALERQGRADLLKKGFSPKASDEIIAGKVSTPEQLADALAQKAAAMSNPAWRDRYANGGLVEVSEANVWNAVISLAPPELRSQVAVAEHDILMMMR